MAQTRFWCEQGLEPKGIMVIRQVDSAQPASNKYDDQGELADSAAKKNVCLINVTQLLAIYGEVLLNKADTRPLQEKIVSTSGWLEGFDLDYSVLDNEPHTENPSRPELAKV
jgi:hypothetical protein